MVGGWRWLNAENQDHFPSSKLLKCSHVFGFLLSTVLGNSVLTFSHFHEIIIFPIELMYHHLDEKIKIVVSEFVFFLFEELLWKLLDVVLSDMVYWMTLVVVVWLGQMVLKVFFNLNNSLNTPESHVCPLSTTTNSAPDNSMLISQKNNPSLILQLKPQPCILLF